MKLTKKLISVILAVVMLICMSTNVFANGASDMNIGSKDLYISSESAPNNADEFARDHFAHFHAETLETMGFTADEVTNMRLAPAFQALPFDNSITLADSIYHYPVVTKGKIVGILKVTYYENKYNYQLEFGKFAQLLNELSTASDNPAKIILSNNAYYAVTNKKVDILETFANADQVAISYERSIARNVAEKAFARSKSNVIKIGNDFAYPEKVKPTITRQLYNYLIPIPIVDCTFMNEPANVCWASTIGSIADFLMHGSLGQNNWEAVKLRDQMAIENISRYGCVDGHIVDMPDYIYRYAGYMTTQQPKIDWQTLMFDLSVLNRPMPIVFYPHYFGYESHMVGLCGAEWESDDPYNENYWSICIMDPVQGYVVMGYNSSYVCGPYVGSWYATFR